MNKQGDKGISWTDYSSNPVYVLDNATGKRGWHCTRVSNGLDPSGCDFCYAASLNLGRFGTGLDFIAENDDKVTWQLNEKELQSWTRKQAARIFPFDMTDIFHRGISEDMVVKCFAAMLLSPQITFQVLTKRPAVMKRLFSSYEWWGKVLEQAVNYAAAWKLPVPNTTGLLCPPPNIWAGTTVATMKDAAARLDVLCATPAAVRWVSLEPQLEAVTFQHWFDTHGAAAGRIDWIVQGGESGSDRPFLEEWARSMKAECADAGVAFFLKQFGKVWAREHNLIGKDSHGKKMEHWPEDLRVHDFPEAKNGTKTEME